MSGGDEREIEAVARVLQGPPMVQQSGIFPENLAKAEKVITVLDAVRRSSKDDR